MNAAVWNVLPMKIRIVDLPYPVCQILGQFVRDMGPVKLATNAVISSKPTHRKEKGGQADSEIFIIDCGECASRCTKFDMDRYI